MSVYFIQAINGGPVKIGRANNVAARLRDLQIGSPVRLQVVAEFTGGPLEEASLHRRFSSYRLHGEWFEPGEDLTAFVRGLRATASIEFQVASKAIASRRMPPGRWLMVTRAVTSVMDDQWRTTRDLTQRMGLPYAGRESRASRVGGGLTKLHCLGWVEKQVAVPAFSAPHRWRLTPAVSELLAARTA